MTVLMIVESPKKAKEIGGFLGEGYVVKACYGHIRDLPSKAAPGELVSAVSSDFVARYEVSEGSSRTVAGLKEAAAKADRVVLATDPDREGEAIAWHLMQVLRLKAPQRVTYTEITPKAIKAALAQPRTIDMNLVHAQEARRILDRIVGFKVSPVLSNQSGQALSAGRVQSPAVRLIVEREREISRFVPRQHYGATLTIDFAWSAQWIVKPHLPAGEKLWLDGEIATRVAGSRSLEVVEFEDSQAQQAPAAPFTTSTMQQEASKRLGLGAKASMDAAQGLFDSGHISYHRTDSPNLSADSQAAIRAYAEAAGLPVASEARRWKAKAGAQEGHEAMRPTNMAVEVAGETDNERALYQLIRARSLASQLADAVYATRRVKLLALDLPAIDGVPVHFEGRGRVLISQGWRVAYAGDAKDEGEGEAAEEAELTNPIPVLTPGSKLTVISGRRDEKKTEPPRRFTEAGLMRELEERAIGRPSTWTAIITNISSRGYVVPGGPKAKYLVPTKTGEAIVDALVGKCQFIDYGFTAGVEGELDQVAAGNRPAASVIGTSWRQLERELSGLQISSSIEPQHPCPDCKKAMRLRTGGNGKFWACSGYPDCRCTLPDAGGKPGKRAEASEHRCTKDGCGKPLIHRVKKGKSGHDFYGCSGFPTCKASYETGKDGKPVFASKK